MQSLQEIDDYLHNHTPFLGGDRPNAVDCLIAPRLYHVQVAMKELKVPSWLSLAEVVLHAHEADFKGSEQYCVGSATLEFSEIGCDTAQGWEIPSSLTDLHDYMKRIQSRDSWKQAYYSPEKVRPDTKAVTLT